MDSEHCKTMVYSSELFGRSYQCQRKAVKDGYCKQHHPDSVEKRKQKSEGLYNKTLNQRAMCYVIYLTDEQLLNEVKRRGL